MLPSEFGETPEIGVGRDHGAAVFQGDRCVLGVRDQLSGGARRTAQSFEDRHVIGARTNDSSVRTLRERRHEGECRVEGDGRIERPCVGHDANETGKNENGEREGLRPRGHASDPPSICGVLRGRTVDVCVDQYVDIGKNHGESAASEAGSILIGLQRSGPVKIDAGTGS